MDEERMSFLKKIKALAWVPPVLVLLMMPLYFFHLERELKLFRRTADSYKKFMEATYSSPEEDFNRLPVSLRNVPFGEKTGLVLGSKIIDVRGVSNPHNASIVQKKDSDGYLIFFRYDFLDENVCEGLTSHIGCAELDANFVQTKKEFIPIDVGSVYAQDPRVLKRDDKLFLFYNDLVRDKYMENARIMCMGEVDIASGKLKAIAKFDPHIQAMEKNWVPFDYKDQEGRSDVYFEYSIVPLKVLKVSNDEKNPLIHFPSTYNKSLQRLSWPETWGSIRGGTTAQKVGDQYLAFFHSCFQDKNEALWYCVGAYTFEAAPPFRITGISSYPILFENIYGTPPLNSRDPLRRVIFPCGFVVEERAGREVIQLSCGENDTSIKVVTLDKKELLSSLKKIKLATK